MTMHKLNHSESNKLISNKKYVPTDFSLSTQTNLKNIAKLDSRTSWYYFKKEDSII